MASIAIIYHSGYGRTEMQAQAVYEGAAAVPGVTAHIISVEETSFPWDTLDAADAIIFGSPTYMGSVSGPFKHFMDDTGTRWLKLAWKDKLAAGFTNSGGMSGDKLGTLMQLVIFACQHGMVWIPLGMPPGENADYSGDPKATNRMGAYLGAMAQSARDASPSEGDLETARLLGQRVAQLAQRWKSGKE